MPLHDHPKCQRGHFEPCESSKLSVIIVIPLLSYYILLYWLVKGPHSQSTGQFIHAYTIIESQTDNSKRNLVTAHFKPTVIPSSRHPVIKMMHHFFQTRKHIQQLSQKVQKPRALPRALTWDSAGSQIFHFQWTLNIAVMQCFFLMSYLYGRFRFPNVPIRGCSLNPWTRVEPNIRAFLALQACGDWFQGILKGCNNWLCIEKFICTTP